MVTAFFQRHLKTEKNNNNNNKTKTNKEMKEKKKEKEKALLLKSHLKFFKSLGMHYIFTKFAAGDVS